jgi:hypothetical protein
MSTNVTTINVSSQKSSLQLQLTALVHGINTDLAGVDLIDLDGVPTKRTDIVTRIQALLDAIAAVKSGRTSLQQVVANQRDLVAQVRGLRVAMKRFLQTKFGPTSPKLQEFGFTQTRRGKAPVKTKAEAQVKSEATRTARGPTGKKLRKAIKAPVAATPTPPPAKAPSTNNPGGAS